MHVQHIYLFPFHYFFLLFLFISPHNNFLYCARHLVCISWYYATQGLSAHVSAATLRNHFLILIEHLLTDVSPSGKVSSVINAKTIGRESFHIHPDLINLFNHYFVLRKQWGKLYIQWYLELSIQYNNPWILIKIYK